MLDLDVAEVAARQSLGKFLEVGEAGLIIPSENTPYQQGEVTANEIKPVAEILEEMGEVAEGVQTTRAACRLGERVGVDLPISNMVRVTTMGIGVTRTIFVSISVTRYRGVPVESSQSNIPPN